MIVTMLQFGLSGFVLGLGLTLAAERLAPRLGLVARPSADRWHRAPVPLLGGLAIAVPTVLGTVVASRSRPDLMVLALAGLAMALAGLVDDRWALSPQVKLLVQIVLAVTLLQVGLGLRLTGLAIVDVLITLLWIVGVTNALNLLDNMDGLAASIAIVAGSFRLLFFAWDGEPVGVATSSVFVGALAGFLIRNFPPATIFMGDAGSLFVGFFLAALTLTGYDRPYSRGIAAVLVIPILLLLIPIFDTAFVTVTRWLSGHPIARGGRDHTSHRLVAIGWSERQTVVLLATLALASGALAVLSYHMDMLQAAVLLPLVVVGLVLLGIHLSRVRSAEPGDAGGGAVVRVLAASQYTRHVATLSLDVVLIVVAYWAAYVIRFEDGFRTRFGELYATLPVVLLAQVVSFTALGLYRRLLQYTGVADVLQIVKAVTVAVAVTVVALVFTRRFADLSRTVFVLDWLLLLLLLLGSRAAFRLFAQMLHRPPDALRRVLIYGAGDGGELIVRELLNNPRLQRVPIGFIDDDRAKHQTLIHGVPVLASADQLEAVLRDRPVTELIISSAKIQGSGLERATEICRRLDVPIRHASIRFD